MKKLVIITAWLVEDPEAYKGKTNSDIEKEILEKMKTIPYVARIVKVTVLDADQTKQPTSTQNLGIRQRAILCMHGNNLRLSG